MTNPRAFRACASCRRRKERCDGVIPCHLCSRRGRAAECCYPVAPLLPEREKQNQYQEQHDICHPISDTPRKRRKTLSKDSESSVSVPVPKLRTFFTDSLGNSAFIGDSGTLAFLKFVRNVAAQVVESCDFVNTGNRNVMLETRSDPKSAFNAANLQEFYNNEDALEFLDYYLTFTRGIFDLYDDDEWRHALDQRRLLAESTDECWDVLLLLALAIGAEQRGQQTDKEYAEVSYIRAHALASQATEHAPSLYALQALVMVSLYQFVTSRRNAAFATLGMIIRASQSLGLHENDAELAIPDTERKSRSRTWKCIRILDLSTCASLGRPLATKEIHIKSLMTNESEEISEKLSLDEQIDLAGIRLCLVAERILTEVYGQENLTIELASEISRYLRQWTQDLPDVLVFGDRKASDSDMAQLLCLSHMTGAYFWSIILLTRPFLICYVLSRLGVKGREVNQNISEKDVMLSSIGTFVDACINSACRCLEATVKLVDHPSLPRRLFLIVNTTLVSALVLGLASFADFDQSFPLQQGLDNAESFLHFVASADPQAAQYLEVLRTMRHAVRQYVRRRDAKKLDNRSVQVDELFGSVYAKDLRNSDETVHTGVPLNLTSSHEGNRSQSNTGEGTIPATLHTGTIEYNPMFETSCITTSPYENEGSRTLTLSHDSRQAGFHDQHWQEVEGFSETQEPTPWVGLWSDHALASSIYGDAF